MLIYVHGANDPESRLPAGLLDIGVSKRQIAVISKTDMPDADVAATRKLLLETGFEEPIFELNSPTRKACSNWWIIWHLSPNRRKQVKNSSQRMIFVKHTRAANWQCPWFCTPALLPRKLVKWLICWVLPSPNVMNRSPVTASVPASASSR